jgi:multiple sugar transport system ATP-binding protein
MTMASRIVVLNKGAIEQVGSPLELYANPINHFVAGFLGAPRMNFFEGRIVTVSGGRVSVTVEGLPELQFADIAEVKLSVGDKVKVGVRPERLKTGEQTGDASFDAKIRLIEHLGRETILHVDGGPVVTTGSDTGTQNITVQLGDVVAFSNGQSVKVNFDLSDAYLFGPDGKTITPAKAATRT